MNLISQNFLHFLTPNGMDVGYFKVNRINYDSRIHHLLLLNDSTVLLYCKVPTGKPGGQDPK